MILWDVGTHERLGSLDHGGIPGPVTARFSPDGKVLVSGNRVLVSGKQEGTLVLWDVRTRQASEPAIAPFASAHRIRFSPDGRVLAVWGAGKITFYDISTHQFLGSKDGVALSKDFKTVASVDNDGVFLHDVSFLADASRESWRARACAIANRNLTRTEWKFYLGRHAIVQPYRATCPDLPEGEDTPAAGVRCP